MSKLQNVLDEYLAVRRVLGYKLRDTRLLLHQFVKFAEQSGTAYITTDQALKWATEPAHARQTWWAKRLGVVRPPAVELKLRINQSRREHKCLLLASSCRSRPRCRIQMPVVIGITIGSTPVAVRVHLPGPILFD